MSKKDPIFPLQQLVKSLNKQEYLLIRKTLVLFSGKRNNASLELLNILKNDKRQVITSKQIAHKLYKDEKKGIKSLRMLKSRLQTKILETLTLEISLSNKADWDELEIVNISLRKKLTQFYYLFLNRNNFDLTNQLLEDIISSAKKYEATHILVEALKFKKYRIGLKNGEKAFDDTNHEIDRYVRIEQAKNKANDLYYKMFIYQNATTNEDKKKYSEFLKTSISELEDDYIETKSSSVKFYLQLLKRNYFLTIDRTNDAILICEDIIKNLRSSPEIFRKERLGSAYFFLSQLETKKRNFEKGLDLVKLASQYFSKNTTSYRQTQDILFQILLYKGDKTNALFTATQLNENIDNLSSKIKNRSHLFYLANAKFKNNNFKDCLRDLYSNDITSDDKTGWDIGIRMLTIKTLIELNQFDDAERFIDAFRKHINHIERKELVRLRDQLIFNILNKLAQYSFDFKRVYELEKESFQRLCGDEYPYGFEFFTHELIPFHEWFMEKAGVKS